MMSVSKGQVNCVDNSNQFLNSTDFTMHPDNKVDSLWKSVFGHAELMLEVILFEKFYQVD